METLREILAPDFLLRNSLYTSLLVGLVCPMIGQYLVLRRLVFLGVALPQVSSCGVAFAFALPGWGLIPHAHDSAEERLLALGGSAVFTIVAILLLAMMERRRDSVEGRVGAAYVLAGAWSILLLVKNPSGEHGLLNLLKGEIIAVSNVDLIVTGLTFALVLGALVWFRKEFMLVSFDRDMAISLKKNVVGWDVFLYLLMGVTIAETVLGVGPLITFGFLLLPPLIAHRLSHSMRQFTILSAVIGCASAFIGFIIAYKWDLPVGPTDVALLGVIYGLAVVWRR